MNPIPLPWMIAGSLALVILAFAGGGATGYKLCENGYFKAEQKADDALDRSVGRAQDQDRALVEQDQQRQTEVREIVREVPKIVDRPVYRGDCVDADGLQLVSRAVNAANGRTPTGGASDGPADLLAATHAGNGAGAAAVGARHP